MKQTIISVLNMVVAGLLLCACVYFFSEGKVLFAGIAIILAAIIIFYQDYSSYARNENAE